MEMFNMYRLYEGTDGFYFQYIAIYPAFLGQYMANSRAPFFLGVCAGMRQFGHFMAISSWPTILLCGDPMNCWRSQYLYSHQVFYSRNDNRGNINFTTWH